jgi:hypothetical protein
VILRGSKLCHFGSFLAGFISPPSVRMRCGKAAYFAPIIENGRVATEALTIPPILVEQKPPLRCANCDAVRRNSTHSLLEYFTACPLGTARLQVVLYALIASSGRVGTCSKLEEVRVDALQIVEGNLFG